MTLISTSGVHTISVQPCACQDRDLFSQLLDSCLFPATFAWPQTAFTFEVLVHYLIDYTICKTTAYSFYEKLRWLTNPADTASVPVCV
jgi:hypothetical protein